MNFNTIKLRMDGQEHELKNFEIDQDSRSIMFDLDETVSVHVEKIEDLLGKDIQILKVGSDDDYTKAKIDSIYTEEETQENKILSVSFYE